MILARPALTRSVTALAGSVLLLGGLAGCDGSGAATDATDAQATPSDAPAGADRQLPGASGIVADITGRTLQVQGQQGQTAVTYSASTTFTAEVAAELSDVAVGRCVMVTPASTGGSGDAPRTTIAAGSVRITAPTDGSCKPGGVRGAPSGRPSGLPSDRPTDRPTDRPSGAPGGLGAFGTVSAISATGFTVVQQLLDPSASGSSSPATTAVTVTVSATTTYTTTRAADASALRVGVCVTPAGRTDDTGSVAARSIAVSRPVDGRCTGGFGGFGRGPGAGTDAGTGSVTGAQS